MQAFKLSADNKPEGPSPLLSRECSANDFQTEFQVLIRLTTELHLNLR